VRRHLQQEDDWLAGGNRYRNDCAQVLRDDENGGRTARQGQLAQYSSASALLHAFDGWSYLGGAVQSHARGDFDVARHLAYYAELRAAMGILAAEGISVLNTRHCAVEGRQSIGFWNGSSHEVVWAALLYLFDDPRGAALLNDVIRPIGHSLEEWLQEFNPGAGVAPIAREWIESWGLDLSRLAEDRDARNIASYRPTPLRIGLGGRLNGTDVIRSAVDIWQLLEPLPADPFSNLDVHLLRRSLEREFLGRTGVPANADRANFQVDVERAVGALLADDPAADRIQGFLLREAQSDDPQLIVRSESRAGVRDAWHHVNVMSRAVILLRVATGVSSWLLQTIGTLQADLDFWMRAVGNERGYWEGDTPSPLTELWDDVQVAIEEAATLSVQTPSMVEVANSQAVALMGQLNRPGLWGLVS
jgi:hypothetical protein